MATVRITDSNGTVRDRVPLVSLKKQQENPNSTTLARVTISRDDLNDLPDLEPGEDRVFIEDGADTFGGVLRSPGRSGAAPTLLAHDFGLYMEHARNVELGQEKISVDDSTLVQECLDATPQLSAGTIETVSQDQTFIFSGISQLSKARKVAEACGGELVFNPDRTVDYVAARGSDKTGTTLSPGNANFVEDTFNVDRDGKSGRTTHLDVYGAGEGTSQIHATIVPEDDPDSYENEVRYSNPDWSAGDGEIWGSRTNKDLKRVETAQTWGQTLIEELPEVEVRVKTVVKGATVALGDRFHIYHAEEGVDEDLRAVEVTKMLDATGTRYETVFSNYSQAHFENIYEDHKDTERYRSAYEGTVNRINDGPGRGPVGPGNDDYVFHIDYPDDAIHEVDAELKIVGTNYRSFHQGASAGGEHSHPVPLNVTSADNSDMQNVEFFSQDLSSLTVDPNTWTTVDNIIPGSETSELRLLGDFSAVGGEGSRDVSFRIENVSEGTYVPDSLGATHAIFDNYFRTVYLPEATNVDGDLIELQAKRPDGAGDFDFFGRVYWFGIGRHNHLVDDTETATADGEHAHTPQPGLIDFNDYPSNVDVFINGNDQNLSIGSGTAPFEETVDVNGVLSQGWNEIRLTSDTIGHLDVSYSADIYRQAL